MNPCGACGPFWKLHNKAHDLMRSEIGIANFKSLSGTKKEHKPKPFGPDIFRWGGGLPHEGVGAKRFGISLETREIKLSWRDIPGFCWDIRRHPKSLRQKSLCSIFGPYTREFRRCRGYRASGVVSGAKKAGFSQGGGFSQSPPHLHRKTKKTQGCVPGSGFGTHRGTVEEGVIRSGKTDPVQFKRVFKRWAFCCWLLKALFPNPLSNWTGSFFFYSCS